MGVKVATTCLHWSQPLVAHSPSSSQQTTAASSQISSLTSRGRRTHSWDRAITCHLIPGAARSGFLGCATSKLLRSSSFHYSSRTNRDQHQTLRRAISDTLEKFSDDDEDDEEFVKMLQELALRFEEDTESDTESRNQKGESTSSSSEDSSGISGIPPYSWSPAPNQIEAVPPPWLGIRPEPPDWPNSQEMVPASVERNANSVDLPLSLRIIKRKKKKWEESPLQAGKSACCSVRKAFSSMVFIIRELQSYALQMREILFYEDLRGILTRVQQEMDASFCWLFQQIFSCTPTLMVSVMLLLANFTVYSMANNVAIAVTPPSPTQSHASVLSAAEHHHPRKHQPRFDSSSIRTFSVGKTASVGGRGGGGGKVRPVAGPTDDGRSEHHHRTIISNGISSLPSTTIGTEGGEAAAEEGVVVVPVEEEARAWNRIVEEASRIQASSRDEALMDHETLQRFVSPVEVEMEPDEGYPDYFLTELTYQQAVSQDPHNPLVLCNYAQFLYLVVRDHDRAEYYFKRAVGVQPQDPESLSRYANFLWLGRKNMEAAEEMYLEAIAADPGNTYHAANYAHFLWNTGGEDTCYPLNSSDDD